MTKVEVCERLAIGYPEAKGITHAAAANRLIRKVIDGELRL